MIPFRCGVCGGEVVSEEMKRLSRSLHLLAGLLACVTISAGGGLPEKGASVPLVFDAVLHRDVIKLKGLLEVGADPNERTFWGWAPLHQAMTSL